MAALAKGYTLFSNIIQSNCKGFRAGATPGVERAAEVFIWALVSTICSRMFFGLAVPLQSFKVPRYTHVVVRC